MTRGWHLLIVEEKKIWYLTPMENIQTIINIIGQIIFGGYFLWNGIKHFKDHSSYTGYAGAMGVPMPSIAVYFTGVLLILGGLGVLFNIFKIISLILLVVFLIPVTFKMHAFWKISDAQQRSSEKISFLKNLALLGAVLLMM